MIEKLNEDTQNLLDSQLRWDYIKSEIRGYTIQYSAKKLKERKELKLKLEKDLYNIENELQRGISEADVERYHYIKEELEKLEELETKGAILRSKAKWAETGEKNTKYFLNLEKKNAIDKHIYQLQLETGEITNDQKQILLEQKRFYKTLYSDPHTCDSDITNIENDIFTYGLPKLTVEEQNICEGLITEEECLKALKNMKNGKSPGCDGFTVEFYKLFWRNIKTLLIKSINYAFEYGKLSIDQRRGIITLIPKRGKKRILLKNWRPITLLNTDYKILTKCLAIRLHSVLPSIINLDQTGFLKDRYIGENIRTIADIIEYTSLKHQPGIILLLDFEKAFDTIKWSFIFDSLQLFNFGPNFIHWIKVIYTDIESTVLNFGNTTGFFKLQRGIRQGCPISPYLFIIAVELLANSIRMNDHIKGINVGRIEIKISQLADDTTIFVSDFNSVRNVLNLVNTFHGVSGLKLNIEKTVAKCIGSLHKYNCNNMFNLNWSDGPVHTLGVTISKDAREILETNFDARLKMFGNILDIWNTRGLSLKGKVTILKSLAIPKLLYPMSVLPVPNNVVKTVDNMIIDFIWSKRRPKIKKDVIMQNIENGGIKVPHFASMVEANRLTWIKRIVGHSSAKWKYILGDLVKPYTLSEFSECHLDDHTINSIGMPFYTQVYEVWNKCRKHPDSKKEYLEQIIWNNRFIQLPVHPRKKIMKSLQWPQLYKAGIVKVKHLFNQNLSFIDLSHFCKANNIKYNFIQLLQLRKAIPLSWVTDITANAQLIDNTDNSYMLIGDTDTVSDIFQTTTKKIYDHLTYKRYVRPTALNKWLGVFEIVEEDWKDIFKQPYFATRETKLQSLQYKIIHRIFPCKKWLHIQTVADTPYCDFCDNEVDDIVHYFFGCSTLNNLWSHLERWWNRTADYQVKVTPKHIIFGFYYDNESFSNVNYVLLLAKWYIKCQRYHERHIDFYSFLSVLKQHLLTEKYICTSSNKMHLFNKKWSTILENL